MARVMRTGSGSARRAPSRVVDRRPRRHKVIMESVTQEKKKLRSVICFEAQAPSGYTFIPAGNPQLTTACKERCRDEGLQIHAVSTTPHHRSHNLSQHVHRIGYHFPSTVVAAVCSELGFYLTTTGKTVPIYAIAKTEDHRRADADISQVTLNTEARDAIRDLFPNIPDEDLNQIIKTAFQKGTKKVGTATELPMARRAQLAVVAHVRHVYTDYDRLLKLTSFHEARGNVEHTTLAKVIEWRGDDENGQTVLEDVFREVIVISDDDDSESEEDAASTAAQQNTSVEILPSDHCAQEIMSQPINNAKALGQDHPRELSEEAPPGFRFVTRSPAKDTINRRGFNRYQAWNRALQEYRDGIQGSEQPRFAGAPAENESSRYSEQRMTAQEAPAARSQDILSKHAGPHRRVVPGSASIDKQAQRVLAIPLMDRQVAKGHVGVQDSHIHSDHQQKYSMHELNTRPLKLTSQESPELQILEEFSGPRNMKMAPSQDGPPLRTDARFRRERLPPQSDRINAPVFVRGPKENRPQLTPSGRHLEPVSLPPPRSDSNIQDSILPSIENSWPSETRRADGAHPLVHMTNRMSLRSVTPGHLHGETMHHSEVIETEGDSGQASKRRRLTYHEGARPESRPGPWSVRSIGLPVSGGFGPNSYRRVDSLPDHRPQDHPHFRRNYHPVEQFSLVGHQRERNTIPYLNGQRTLDTRSVLGRQHISGPREPQNQYGAPSASILVSEGDRTFRAAPAVSNIGPWHPYHGDRSLRSGRVPKESWAMRRTRIDGAHSLPEKFQPDRNMYADGFVRHVDHREPPPFEYVGRRLEPECKANGELSQPARARDLEYIGTKHLSQTHVSSDQHRPLPIGSKAAPSHEHVRTFSDPTAGKIQPRVSLPQVPREMPVSGGFTSLRSSYNHPPSTQSPEQNRPVYVQRVEPRSPYYSVLDERPIVIVD
ncbi:hypothetical protein N7457_007722 [Penicillium paradoxum]|uniref:uncharacterized protein n=1 Tax=Penicillium paradoxum TaxID=176176 RepID=UPI002547FFA2|nr:uncharacterized protein N7457_007722 [Penicillium paradoxum]KAJ5772826.1 hypothetical protein N7457_007722 [Penicillium paradoxum]